MPIKTGLPRSRSIVVDEFIAEDNPVRVIDAFVDSLDLAALGFRLYGAYTFGAPAYPASSLLKIYLYGYFNRIRSSRKLESECGRNLELIWLTASLMPCYHTISTFRTYNVQTAVDDKHCLVAHFSIENIPDVHLLSQTAAAAKTALQAKTLDALADKGYHYGAELHKCAQAGITTYAEATDRASEQEFGAGNFHPCVARKGGS